MDLLQTLGLSLPIIQAPMAGVSTPELAAAVSNAGGLGSIAVGATDAAGARKMIESTRAKTDRGFQVNVFAHSPARRDIAREQAWLNVLRPQFERFGTAPPTHLRVIYKSFLEDEAMLDTLADLAPPVVSFHFGLPKQNQVEVLKQHGCVLLATVTSLKEARAAEHVGIDALVAQGFEAGGHRGVFDPEERDDCLGTLALTRLLACKSPLPVIAAGGIMDGAGVRAVLELGAVAAQLGTAFVACPETSADEGYRAALSRVPQMGTVMTRAISGRPARSLANRFTEWGQGDRPMAPDYPIAYDAGKALNLAAKAAGELGFGAQWAGQGAPLVRAMPAAKLVATIGHELRRIRPMS
ncbi:NAD(P)H-dependent flavin oxidoreductase [Oceaniradius stylonematis]|uniref:NAD(P)H-dependent flavin oxidoreductase n=1 Tax=Oceaniradius stylonematis TaxID=2184161 RepID=UPI00273E8144|nr:nitronate monooxygenase [Oceaniradius stylonematis]